MLRSKGGRQEHIQVLCCHQHAVRARLSTSCFMKRMSWVSLYCRRYWHYCRAGMVHQHCCQCTAASTAHRVTRLSLLCTGTSLTAVSCKGGGLTAAGSSLHMQTVGVLRQHGWGKGPIIDTCSLLFGKHTASQLIDIQCAPSARLSSQSYARL